MNESIVKVGEFMSRGISIYYKLISKNNNKIIYGYSGGISIE
ncbi:hypothetical protein [Clostridium lundense]|nr:hypothetical protein [Clostridium lundense]